MDKISDTSESSNLDKSENRGGSNFRVTLVQSAPEACRGEK